MPRPCSICNRPIPTKRLAAVPETTRCVPCQSARDLTPQELFGNRLRNVAAVSAEGDGEQFHVGGDCYA